MFRPLSETEKKQYLREGAQAALAEAKRREAELHQISTTAAAVFCAYLPKFSPTLEIVQAPFPSDRSTPPFEELWSVRPKVTFE